MYALGVVLYEMLAGRPPFEAENPIALAMRHVAEDAVPPRVLVPSVPKALDAATMRLLAKDPADRPASALAAADEIEGAQAPTRPEVLRPAIGAPVRASGAGRDRPGRSRGRAALLAGALCALFGAFALPAALPAPFLQPGGEGPLAQVLSSLGNAGSGDEGSGRRLASPLGGQASATPKPPGAKEFGREETPEQQDTTSSPPAGGGGETPVSSEQYRYAPQYEPDEGPQYAPVAAPAGPEAHNARPPEPAQPEPEPPKAPEPASPKPALPSPAPRAAPEPIAEKTSPDPVAPENTPPPLGPDEATENPTGPEPTVAAAPQEEADEIVETVQDQVEQQVEGIAPGFSFDDETRRPRKEGAGRRPSHRRAGQLED